MMKNLRKYIVLAAVIILAAVGLFTYLREKPLYGNDPDSIIEVLNANDLYQGTTLELLGIKDFDDDRIVAFLSDDNPSVGEFKKDDKGNYIFVYSETQDKESIYRDIIGGLGEDGSVAIVVSIKNQYSDIMDFSLKANEETYNVNFSSDGAQVQWTQLKTSNDRRYDVEWDVEEGSNDISSEDVDKGSNNIIGEGNNAKNDNYDNELDTLNIIRQDAEVLVSNWFSMGQSMYPDYNYTEWRISSLNHAYSYKDFEGMALELWLVNYEFLSESPENVIMAGPMSITEDGWIVPTYPNAHYLVYKKTGNELDFLISIMENDCYPGTETFDSDLKKLFDKVLAELAYTCENKDENLSRVTRQELTDYKLYRPEMTVKEALNEGFEASISPEGMEYSNDFVSYNFWDGDSTPFTMTIFANCEAVAPRDIKIGDSFKEVLCSLPNEKDWITDSENLVYGKVSNPDIGPEEHATAHIDENGHGIITIVPAEGLPYIQIYFEEGIVDHFTYFYRYYD